MSRSKLRNDERRDKFIARKKQEAQEIKEKLEKDNVMTFPSFPSSFSVVASVSLAMDGPERERQN